MLKSIDIIDLGSSLGEIVYGLKLDISMTGYVMFFVSFLMTFLVFAKNSISKLLMQYFTLVIIILFTVITVIDIELYRNWGFRIRIHLLK